MQFLDENQVQQLLITAKASNNRFFALYHLAIATGMRQGELLGLKWSDLDLEQGMLQVQRQLTKKKGGGFELTTPKTKAGIRRIDLGENTLRILQEHRQQQFVQMRMAGEKWQENDLIFPTDIGTTSDRDNLRKDFNRLLKNAGLPAIRFHDLRHSYAVAALQSGIDIKTVQENLGHHSASFTLDVYGHVSERMRRDGAERMDQFIRRVTE